MDGAVPNPHEQNSASATKGAGASDAVFPDLGLVRVALDAGRVGIWSWDIKSNVVQWSANLESIHGAPAGSFEGTFAGVQNDIHPEDQPEVMAAIQESLRTGKTYQAHYRLAPRPDEEDRWVEAVASVVQENGAPVRLLGICRDVTDRQRLLRELRARAKQQETVARLGERALTETDLQKLFDDVVADRRGDSRRRIRQDPRAGAGRRRAPAARGRRLERRAGRHRAREHRPPFPCRLRARLGRAGDRHRSEIGDAVRERRRCCAIMASTAACRVPIAGRDGRAYGVVGAHTARRRRFGENDVAFLAAIANMIAGAIQRRQADQRHELMIRELRHRSGNLFAQLLALFSQTARNSRSVPDLVTKYQARVLALANAHRLITEGGWRSTSMADLLRVLLAPYLDRVTLSGPDVFLEPDPSFALSSAVHELATNAAKYGSLSVPDGQLALSWTVNRSDESMTLELDWIERGGPPPRRGAAHRLRVAPDRHGDRAPARRRARPHVRAGRARRAPDPSAHPRALAAAGRAGRSPWSRSGRTASNRIAGSSGKRGSPSIAH